MQIRKNPALPGFELLRASSRLLQFAGDVSRDASRVSLVCLIAHLLYFNPRLIAIQCDDGDAEQWGGFVGIFFAHQTRPETDFVTLVGVNR